MTLSKVNSLSIPMGVLSCAMLTYWSRQEENRWCLISHSHPLPLLCAVHFNISHICSVAPYDALEELFNMFSILISNNLPFSCHVHKCQPCIAYRTPFHETRSIICILINPYNTSIYIIYHQTLQVYGYVAFIHNTMSLYVHTLQCRAHTTWTATWKGLSVGRHNSHHTMTFILSNVLYA